MPPEHCQCAKCKVAMGLKGRGAKRASTGRDPFGRADRVTFNGKLALEPDCATLLSKRWVAPPQLDGFVDPARHATARQCRAGLCLLWKCRRFAPLRTVRPHQPAQPKAMVWAWSYSRRKRVGFKFPPSDTSGGACVSFCGPPQRQPPVFPRFCGFPPNRSAKAPQAPSLRQTACPG